ncbi:MAG TPA: DUF2911 domain-containing protein [Cyclobacteriaceae bacterium]
MRNKIFIGIAAVIVIFVGWSIYGLFFATPASPPDSASGSYGDLSINVNYSRPYKKGRLIFGEESAGALQPYGKYWRLGANAATEITFDKDVNFAGEPVKAGTYRMYAVPGATEFEISLNSEVGVFFGAAEPDYDLDVVKVNIPVQSIPETEQFTISFASDSTGAIMNLAWDKTLVVVPITLQ